LDRRPPNVRRSAHNNLQRKLFCHIWGKQLPMIDRNYYTPPSPSGQDYDTWDISMAPTGSPYYTMDKHLSQVESVYRSSDMDAGNQA